MTDEAIELRLTNRLRRCGLVILFNGAGAGGDLSRRGRRVEDLRTGPQYGCRFSFSLLFSPSPSQTRFKTGFQYVIRFRALSKDTKLGISPGGHALCRRRTG